MSNEVKFKYGTSEEYASKIKEGGGVDASALYFVTKEIENDEGVDFGGTIYRGNDALGTTCADHLKTTKAITVEGGPLADLLKGSGISEIPAGTDLESLLFSWLCVEKWASNPRISNEGSISTTYANPNFTLSNSGSTVEVGTEVTLSAIAGTAPTSSPVSRQYAGFDYGYSAANDNTKDGSNPPAVSVSNIQLMSGTFKLTRQITGFAANTGSVDSSSDSSHADCSIEGLTLQVKEGTNTVSATMTGPGHQGTIVASPEYYACSNLGNTSEEHKVAGVEQKTVQANSPKQGTKSLSVTGKYKYFIGFYSDSTFTDKVYTSESVRTTDMKQSNFMNGTTINTTITVDPGTKGMYIAIPEGIDDTGASLIVKQSSAFDLPVGAEMAENVRTLENMACQGSATKNYKIFTWSLPGGTAGEETFSITKF